MYTRVLASVAAAALIAGTLYVSAQEKGPPGKGETGQATEPKAEPKGKADPKGKEGAPPKTGETPKQTPETKKTAPKTGETAPKTDQKATEPKPGTTAPKTGETKTSPKAGADGDPKTGKSGSKTGTTVNITTQQRTEIRQTIIQQKNAPRVTSVNFTVSVGTVVPTTVTVAVLPARVIEIYPQWRGYRYFIYEERIIIVEPDSLRIVFIIET
jgi:hypothetical protein